MMKAAQRAFEIFEEQLTARAESGRGIDSARALFDLWIDAAEQAYAEAALSPEFRKVYGALTNAQMRLRSAVQQEVEQVCGLFGMPTRTEVDSAHRKIAELERALRRVNAAQAKAASSVATRTAPAGKSKPVESAAPTTEAAQSATSRKIAAKRAAVAAKKQATPRKATKAAKQPTARKATKNAALAKKPAAKRTAAAKTAAKAPAKSSSAKRPAARTAASKRTKTKRETKPTPSQPAPAKTSAVVSMKDWVGRNAKANGNAVKPDEPAKNKPKRSTRK